MNSDSSETHLSQQSLFPNHLIQGTFKFPEQFNPMLPNVNLKMEYQICPENVIMCRNDSFCKTGGRL